MICRKRNFKAFRFIICLAVVIAASSVFLNIEPMASESPAALLALTEQNTEGDIQLMEASSANAPLSTEKALCKPLSATHSVDSANITDASTNLQSDLSEDDTCAPANPPQEAPAANDSSSEEQITPDVPQASEENSSYYEEPSYEENSSIHSAAPAAGQPVEGEYSDLDLLAAICQIEAGYDYDGCLAVANVVLNRLNTGFDDCQTIYQVIYYPNQFATTWMPHYLKDGTSSVARQAAADALAGANNIGDYLYFYADWYAKPETLNCSYLLIGGNCFLDHSL